MTKVRGGKSILDDLEAVRRAVDKAGRDAIEYSIHPRLIEDIGRDLRAIARELERIGDVLDPILVRIEKRAALRELTDLEERVISVERWIARYEAEHRQAPIVYEVRKQEERG